MTPPNAAQARYPLDEDQVREILRCIAWRPHYELKPMLHKAEGLRTVCAPSILCTALDDRFTVHILGHFSLS